MTKAMKEEIRLNLVKRINGINALMVKEWGNGYELGDVNLVNARDKEIIETLTKKQKAWVSDLILDARFSMIGK